MLSNFVHRIYSEIFQIHDELLCVVISSLFYADIQVMQIKIGKKKTHIAPNFCIVL